MFHFIKLGVEKNLMLWKNLMVFEWISPSPSPGVYVHILLVLSYPTSNFDPSEVTMPPACLDLRHGECGLSEPTSWLSHGRCGKRRKPQWNMNGTWYPYDQFITGKWPIYSWYLWKMMFTLYTRYIQVPSTNFDAVCQYMLLDGSTISTVALEARSKLIVQWPSQCRSRHKFFGI
jgi:hypothetical protein